MFKEPEKHLIIGIVKSRMVVDTLGDREDIMSVAMGQNNEAVSFKGFKCIFTEQDQVSDLQEMVKLIQKQECLKRYVMKGFIDYHELMQIVEQPSHSNQSKERQLATQIGVLVSSFE